jgi:hypothetical protein
MCFIHKGNNQKTGECMQNADKKISLMQEVPERLLRHCKKIPAAPD